ncbi:MAG: hypothetical protein HY609_05160 [Deltaproteobacteria bacterium]|nr:hypothetical protein [Deltaproteobacteria bacterium]MBI4224301.1 hypothetical protein [Deltaproteobacteria bacterium]
MNGFVLSAQVLISPQTAASVLGEVPPEVMSEAVPSLDILGGALMEAQIESADRFVEEVGGLRQVASAKPFDPETVCGIRDELSRLLDGIEDSTKWGEARTRALQRHAGSFSDTPSAEQLSLVSPSFPKSAAISEHPLGGIVERREDGYRVFLSISTRGRRSRIHGLVQEGKRLQISLKRESAGEDANQTLQKFLARILGLENPERVEIISGQTLRDRKSVAIHGLSIVEVLDRLNDRGPKFLSRKETGNLHNDFQTAQTMLEKMEQDKKEAQWVEITSSHLDEMGRAVSAVREELKHIREVLAQGHLTQKNAGRVRESFSRMAKEQEAFASQRERFYATSEVAKVLPDRLIRLVESIMDPLRTNYDALKKQLDETPEEVMQAQREVVSVFDVTWQSLRTECDLLLAALGEVQNRPAEVLQALQERAMALSKDADRFLELASQLEHNLSRSAAREESSREAIPGLPPREPSPPQYAELAPYLQALGYYVLVPPGRALSILDEHLARVTADLNRVRREAVAAFGTEIDLWPGNVRDSFQNLPKFSEKIRTAIKDARRVFRTIPGKMQEGAHPAGLRIHVFSALVRVKSLLGSLREDQEGLIEKAKLRKWDSNLLARWGEHLEKTRAAIEAEKGRSFELRTEELEELDAICRSKPGGWREESQAMEAEAESLKLSVAPDDWTEEMAFLFKTTLHAVQSIRENIDHLTKHYGALKTEMAKPTPATSLLVRHYSAARKAVSKIRQNILQANKALTGKVKGEKMDVPNLIDAIRNPKEPQPKTSNIPDRVMEILGWQVRVEGGEAKIDGVSFTLRGNIVAQDKKIRDIAATLAIPPSERELGAALAHPMFREEVERRLRTGEPLRKLLAVNDQIGVAVVFDHRFGTAFYIPYKTGWVMGDCRAIVPMFHGGGGARSTGLTMQAPAIRLRRLYGFNAVAFDTPNHGQSVRDKRFHNLDEFIGWMYTLLGYFRYLSSGKVPVVAIGRSHGDNALDEYAARYPGRLDGVIGISGYDPAWGPATLPTLRRRVAQGTFDPHPTGTPMVEAHDTQWTFLRDGSDDRRRQTPTLYMSGTADEEYSEGVPDFYEQRRARAERLGHRMLVVEGGAHDLLSLNRERMRTQSEGEEMKRVYEEVNAFIEGVIRKFIEENGQ